MTDQWTALAVADLIVPVSVAGKDKVQTSDYMPSGRFPIIDQGQSAIAGWTDNECAVIFEPLPLIVFGDHTRAFKYVDTPFARGADGTQLMRPNDEVDPRFFYFACLALDLPARGYNRHFTSLKEKIVHFPVALDEQRAIAAVLDVLRSGASIEARTERALEELKAAAMGELFSRGLRGEEQKDTEVGRVPQSWEVAPLGDYTTRTQYGLSVRGLPEGKYPILRMNCQLDGRVLFRDLQYVNLSEREFADFRLEEGDLLFNRTNSYELVGRMAIFEGERDAVFASYLVRVTLNQAELIPRFVNYYFNQAGVQAGLRSLASRGVSQANINATKLRGVHIPKPSLDEQREIVAILDTIDRKIDLLRRKRALLDELFKSLLHKLMTGEVRVSDLDLSALPPSSEASP